MKWCLGLWSTAFLAGVLAVPCRAGEVGDYLTKDGKLKEAVTVKTGVIQFLAPPGIPVLLVTGTPEEMGEQMEMDTASREPSPAAGAEGDPAADPLPAQGTVRLGNARYRHGTRIEIMALSADGKLAVTASGNSPYNSALAGRFSPARVWDLTDGHCLYSLPNERGAYHEYPEAVSLSPDGKTLATRDDKFLYFWDAATGKELRKVKFMPDSGGGRSPTEWLTFTPDGKQVAVTLMGDAVQLIDVETCKVIRTFAPGAAARACVFSPDGKLMATGGYEQEKGVYYARLWEVATGKELRRFAIGHELNRPIGALAFSHDGTKLAGGSWGDGRLRLFDVATGKELKVFPKIGEDIRRIAFAPDGKTVAAAGDNVYLYDPDTGKERLSIPLFDDPVVDFQRIT